jgi:hypothetical protein
MMRQPGLAGTVKSPGAQRSPKIIVGSLGGATVKMRVRMRIALAKTTVFLYSVWVSCAVLQKWAAHLPQTPFIIAKDDSWKKARKARLD